MIADMKLWLAFQQRYNAVLQTRVWQKWAQFADSIRDVLLPERQPRMTRGWILPVATLSLIALQQLICLVAPDVLNDSIAIRESRIVDPSVFDYGIRHWGLVPISSVPLATTKSWK